jgi:hypothetical protein
MVTCVKEIVIAALVASRTCTTSPATDEPVQDDVPVQMRTYLPATAVTFSENVTTRFAPTATLDASSTGVRLDTVGAVESVHTAYNVAFEEIVNVEAAAREVPPHADPAAG